jgi:hypothetical protein
MVQAGSANFQVVFDLSRQLGRGFLVQVILQLFQCLAAIHPVLAHEASDPEPARGVM